VYVNIRVVLCRLAESEDAIVVRVFDADTIIMDEMFLWRLRKGNSNCLKCT